MLCLWGGQGEANILFAFHKGLPATIPLSQALNSPQIRTAGIIFSLGAIITSYFGVGISFRSFFKDLISSFGKKSNQFVETILTFCPLLVVALLNPNLFLKALDVVGGFGILLVFGVLPSLIVIKNKEWPMILRILGGVVLIGIFGVLMFLELLQEVGLLQISVGTEYWDIG